MCDLPTDIDADEKIVRAVMSPYHLKNGKLGPRAFRAPPSTDEVSVVRHRHGGSDFCKARGKELSSDRVSYMGLAVIRAEQVKEVGSSVADSRDVYCGHADISHGIVVPREEPPQSEQNMKLTERCVALVAKALFYPDPDIGADGWTGEDLICA